MTTKTAIYVGAQKEAIAEARGAINDILKTSVDQSTKTKALETLQSLCQINNTTISGCTIYNGDKETK